MNTQKKKKLLTICAVVLVLAAAAAAYFLWLAPKNQASAPGEESGAPAAAADETFRPQLATDTQASLVVYGHYDNFEALEEEFVRFRGFYPNVQLSYQKLDNYNNAISESLAGQEAPDIYFLYPDKMADERFVGAVGAAEDLAAVPGIDLSRVQEGAIHRDAEGHVPYVPVLAETHGMLVNEKIFADCGIAVPTTYDGLLDACRKLQEAGYAHPVMGFNGDGSLLYSLYFPYFCGSVQGSAEALASLNAMDASAGERVRPALQLAQDFLDQGFIDLEACGALANYRYAVIERFFEGDIPMMFTKSTVVSATRKREDTEPFKTNPFPYSFAPVPSTEQGGYICDTVSMGLAVNRNGGNLEMANEFMRFLVNSAELNRIANTFRLVPTAANLDLSPLYAPFGAIYPDRIIYTAALGLNGTAEGQVNKAGIAISKGEMTVDEVVAAFGTLP